MICAYNKNLLLDAQQNLGWAFDCAVNHCNLSADTFMDFFIASEIAEYFGKGVSKFVCGTSGTELVLSVFDAINYKCSVPEYFEFDRTSEYWAGWILCWFQWKANLSFKKIHEVLSMQEIIQSYNPLHEAPEEKFFEVMMNRIKSKAKMTKLQSLRKSAGLTQKQLAELSGINLRTLQQYEIGLKDINKASGDSINALTRILHCNFYDVMEI